MQTGAKKRITAKVKMSWLLYDIMNETSLRGRTILNRDNHKEVASMFASADEENREKILRSIKKALSEVQTELSEYLNEENTEADNGHCDGSSDLVLRLDMPGNFNEATTQAVVEAIHDYIKDSALAEWYQVTNPGEAEKYAAIAAVAMRNIQKSASRRRRPQAPSND